MCVCESTSRARDRVSPNVCEILFICGRQSVAVVSRLCECFSRVSVRKFHIRVFQSHAWAVIPNDDPRRPPLSMTCLCLCRSRKSCHSPSWPKAWWRERQWWEMTRSWGTPPNVCSHSSLSTNQTLLRIVGGVQASATQCFSLFGWGGCGALETMLEMKATSNKCGHF